MRPAPKKIFNRDYTSPEVAADAAQLLYRHGIGGLVVSMAASSALALVAVPQIRGPSVWCWWALMALVLVCRAGDQILFRRRRAHDKDGVVGVLRFSYGVLATAGLWATFSFAFLAHLNQTGRAFTAIVLSAMVGGGVTVLAPSTPLSTSYCAALLLPPAIQFFRLPGIENAFLGALSCFFFGVMVASSRVTHDALMSAVTLSRANERLMRGMEQEQERTEAANRKLRETQADLEVRVLERTAELSNLNQQLHVEIGVRNRTELELRSAFAAKQVLLQEVHHRVKNNLQIISSLLSLQADSMPAEVRRLLVDCQRRVRSIALVHEQLYGRQDPGELDFGEYARSLAIDLRDTYERGTELIKLRFELEPVLLAINEAIPCGLILNELLTNSLKYAFPQSRTGEIAIGIKWNEPNGEVALRVADDGVGMPPGFDWRSASSLGLQLVHVLAGQLNGQVNYQEGTGACFTITFHKSGVAAKAATTAAS